MITVNIHNRNGRIVTALTKTFEKGEELKALAYRRQMMKIAK